MRTAIHMWPALALALGGGCGTGPFEPYRPGSLSDGAIVLPVPFVRQEHERSCGWSAASMVFQYYGQRIGDEDRGLLLRGPGSDDGVTGRAMKELFERNGFRACVFAGVLLDDGSPRGIAYHLRRGRPVVAMLSFEESGCHYVVVSGLDARRELVVVVDPVRGNVVCRRPVLQKLWEGGNCFALLAVPVSLHGRDHVGPDDG